MERRDHSSNGGLVRCQDRTTWQLLNGIAKGCSLRWENILQTGHEVSNLGENKATNRDYCTDNDLTDGIIHYSRDHKGRWQTLPQHLRYGASQFRKPCRVYNIWLAESIHNLCFLVLCRCTMTIMRSKLVGLGFSHLCVIAIHSVGASCTDVRASRETGIQELLGLPVGTRHLHLLARSCALTPAGA